MLVAARPRPIIISSGSPSACVPGPCQDGPRRGALQCGAAVRTNPRVDVVQLLITPRFCHRKCVYQYYYYYFSLGRPSAFPQPQLSCNPTPAFQGRKRIGRGARAKAGIFHLWCHFPVLATGPRYFPRLSINSVPPPPRRGPLLKILTSTPLALRTFKSRRVLRNQPPGFDQRCTDSNSIVRTYRVVGDGQRHRLVSFDVHACAVRFGCRH